MSEKQELGPNQRRWVKALRSGRYKQGDAFLRHRQKHCCLGVGCRIFRIEGAKRRDGLWYYGSVSTEVHAPDELVAALALRDETGTITGVRLEDSGSLIEANDKGASFAQIADFIEANPEAVFTESK